jgi:hypothetical protein
MTSEMPEKLELVNTGFEPFYPRFQAVIICDECVYSDIPCVFRGGMGRTGGGSGGMGRTGGGGGGMCSTGGGGMGMGRSGGGGGMVANGRRG